MSKYLSVVLCLLLVQSSFAQAPVAKIAGPKEKRSGRMIVLKTDGTIGDDLKISSNADTNEWYTVTFHTGGIGVIFETEKAGNYAFAVAVNKEGKTAVAVHTVTVVDPGPGPGPGPIPQDELTRKFQSAYSIDAAAGVGTGDERKQLAANYKAAMATLIPDCKITKDLQDDMKELNDQHLKGRLPNLRAAIGPVVLAELGSDPAAVLDKSKAQALWTKLADSLSKLVP